MALKENIKQVNRAMGRRTLIALRWVINRMPYKLYRPLSRFLIFAGMPLINAKKRIAIQNLQSAFGLEKDEEEIARIARTCFKNFGKGMIDLIYLADRPEMIRERVEIVGKEHLEKAFEKGKGAIVVSAHFGNFILMYLRMIEEGYKTNVIMRRTRDKEFEKYISRFRDERGLKTIYDLPPRKCVQESLRALRKNELLFILLDQNYGSEGRVFVDFFGRKAATAAGPVVFSNRTGAPVLPIFIMREDDEHHKIVIEEPIQFARQGDDQETVVANVAQITKIIENKIRQYPHEWGGWMHNRWKSRTREEQRIIDALKGKGATPV